jgi:hypothetical protein
MPQTDPPVLRSTRTRALFIVAILAAIVSIPYLFPAPLSISRSYVVGFSNRTAILLLFIGTALLAVYTRGKVARTETKDSSLGWQTLVIGLAATLVYCFRVCGLKMLTYPGPEALYLSNRVQLLAAGLTPYKQFEFVYGPLLLYPIYWTQKFFHLTPATAFNVVWIAFWELGVLAIWVTVREVDLPIPSRRLVFGFLVLLQFVFLPYGSLSYSPFRAYLSTFCIVINCTLWKRWRKPWLLVLSTLLSLMLAICCSMDQAVGVTCGLLAFLFFQAYTNRKDLPWSAAISALAGAVVCFAVADRLRLTEAVHSFGSGGYSYPLLPSFGIYAVVFTYIIAGCALYRVLYLKFLGAENASSFDRIENSSLILPLVVAGCSMLPNALGRCDILHITAAIPAFVIGVLVIYSTPSIRTYWTVAAIIGLVFLPRYDDRIMHLAFHLRHKQMPMTLDPALTSQGFTTHLGDNQWYVSPSHLTESQLPCDRQYFSPSYMPLPSSNFLLQCLDTGYYLGFTDVITPKTIEYKVEELRQRPTQPLLMESSPLEAQLPLQLASTDDLYRESATFWVPKVRHKPLTYAPIIDYIREHYLPGPVMSNGLLQIWYPKIGSTPNASPKVPGSSGR